MQWFEQQRDARATCIAQDHPGIEAIQSCATFIHRHGLNTSLLTTDVRKASWMPRVGRVVDGDPFGQWSELKQLSGLSATALAQAQLDQIPMKRWVTWYPPPEDRSPATLHARAAVSPSRGVDASKGFLATLPAECRSMVSAVLYVRLGNMAAHMATIEQVMWDEITQRIRLETIPLERLYDRPSHPKESRPARTSTSGNSSRASSGRSRSRRRRDTQQAPKASTVDGVDYV